MTNSLFNTRAAKVTWRKAQILASRENSAKKKIELGSSQVLMKIRWCWKLQWSVSEVAEVRGGSVDPGAWLGRVNLLTVLALKTQGEKECTNHHPELKANSPLVLDQTLSSNLLEGKDLERSPDWPAVFWRAFSCLAL